MKSKKQVTTKQVDQQSTPAAKAKTQEQSLEAFRQEQLRAATRKPLRHLFQIDALITRERGAGRDYQSSGFTDRDGDCLNCQETFELRSTGDTTVRIQVPAGILGAEAARVLRKAADWVESSPSIFKPKLPNSRSPWPRAFWIRHPDADAKLNRDAAPVKPQKE